MLNLNIYPVKNDGLSSLLNGKQDGCACVLGMGEETELSSHLQ